VAGIRGNHYFRHLKNNGKPLPMRFTIAVGLQLSGIGKSELPRASRVIHG
jgi:hypothetical protein